jgi:hypothetical protein
MIRFARLAPAFLLLAGAPALAQIAAPSREAPPEIDRSRPGGDPADRTPDRSGGGPTGNDIIGEREGGGVARGVVRPPMGIDPGIQGTVPEPTPNTTPVIPPPGASGGDRTIQPR